MFSILSGSPILLYHVFSSQMNLFSIYLFKVIIPFISCSFGVFGINLCICVKNKYCNKKIHEEDKRKSFLEIYD